MSALETQSDAQRPAKYLNHRGMPKQTDGYPVFLEPKGICFKHLQPLGPDLLKIRDQNRPHMIWILLPNGRRWAKEFI